MNEITVAAPAKINLTLDVGPKRSDGYHEIRSVMQTISLMDFLTVQMITQSTEVTLEVTGDQADGVPVNSENLVVRAAMALRQFASNPPGLHLQLQKNIPAQAGLAGGSSDAAAALRAVHMLLRLNLSPGHLAEIATGLGADVPFFLQFGTALAEGRGERITPLPDLTPPWDLVIVKPPVGVSTAWAYGALDAQNRETTDATARWLSGAAHLHNDFHEVIVSAFPEIAAAHQFLLAARERAPETLPLLCGSGSAIFCRATSAKGARRMAERAQSAGMGEAWAEKTIERPG